MNDRKVKNRVELTSAFLEFENQFDLFSRSVEGFHYWHLLRKWVFDNVCNLSRSFEFGGHSDFHAQFKGPNVVKHSLGLINQVGSSYVGLHGESLKKSDVVFLGNWKKTGEAPNVCNLFLDGLIEKLPMKSTIVERPNQLSHTKDSYSDITVYSDYFEFEWLVSLSIGRWSSNANRVYSDLVPIINKLEERFGVHLDRSALKKRVDYVTSGYYELSKLAKHYFEDKNIKCVVEIEHYCVFCLICNKVFHELGIPVIEIQHGQIGPGHIAYNLSANNTGIYLPDIVATFGQYWIDECNYPCKLNRMVSVGSVPLDRDVLKYKTRDERNGHTILIISQGQDGGALSKLTCDLAKLIDHLQYEIIYKLHPSEYKTWESIHPDLVELKDCVSVVSNEHELGYYIDSACAVVGISSTVLFEAVAYGKDVYVLDTIDSEIAAPLVSQGLARKFVTAKELIWLMAETRHDVKHSHVDYLWKPNALDNIKELVCDVVSKDRA